MPVFIGLEQNQCLDSNRDSDDAQNFNPALFPSNPSTTGRGIQIWFSILGMPIQARWTSGDE